MEIAGLVYAIKARENKNLKNRISWGLSCYIHLDCCTALRLFVESERRSSEGWKKNQWRKRFSACEIVNVEATREKIEGCRTTTAGTE
jgi:hypothetical protein